MLCQHMTISSFLKWHRWTNTWAIFCCQIGPWWTYQLSFAEKWTRVFAETQTRQLRLKCCQRSFAPLPMEQVIFSPRLLLIWCSCETNLRYSIHRCNDFYLSVPTVGTFSWELSRGKTHRAQVHIQVLCLMRFRRPSRTSSYTNKKHGLRN